MSVSAAFICDAAVSILLQPSWPDFGFSQDKQHKSASHYPSLEENIALFDLILLALAARLCHNELTTQADKFIKACLLLLLPF